MLEAVQVMWNITSIQNPTLLNNLTDWDMFQATLVNRINLWVALSTNDELEEEVQKFISDIQHVAWEATPLIPTKVKGNTYPQEVRDKIAENAKLEKGGKWLETRDLKLSWTALQETCEEQY